MCKFDFSTVIFFKSFSTIVQSNRPQKSRLRSQLMTFQNIYHVVSLPNLVTEPMEILLTSFSPRV